jgi:hypothetical protein
VALTVIGRREDASILGEETNYERLNASVLMLYNVLFWPCILMGSVVMPFQEIYNDECVLPSYLPPLPPPPISPPRHNANPLLRCSGHFTPWTKFLSTFKTMAKMYAVFGVIGGVLVGIMIGGGYFHSMDALQVTVKALSNTGGLVVIVFLLGYGLVEFPRYLWQAADLEKQLLLTQMAAASEFKNFSEVSLKCSMSVADVVCTTAAAKKTHNEMLIHACNVIRDDCPKEFHSGSAGTVRGGARGGGRAKQHASERSSM